MSLLIRLLERQEAIQKELAKKHLKNGTIILYDITSVYFEGEYKNSKIVAFGHSRDKKRGYEQIVVGLLTNELGCPIATKVFSGNTSDQTTVFEQAQKLADDYQVKDVIFVGDRGMLTPKRIREVNSLGYKTLTALSHAQIQKFWKQGVIKPDMLLENNVVEIPDPKNASIRYFLCKNPKKKIENKATRDALIAKTKEAFEKIITMSSRKNEHQKSAKIGEILKKYKTGKFFHWEFQNGKLIYRIKEDKINVEDPLDGCFMVRTDSSAFKKDDAVRGYKSLAFVEKAFRNIKTVRLEIRPVYHQLDERIKAHVFLCMLSYYVEWHALQLLQPIFEQDGEGADKCFSFARIIERLRSIRIQDCTLGKAELKGIITKPDKEQQQILDLLKCSQNLKFKN